MGSELVALMSLVLFGLGCALSMADVLDDVTRMQPGKTMRFSTGLYDPESNADAYHISPGETMTFAELEGPGEIRHIWFTVSGERRWPRTLVLRLYWDGSPIPSVESPIGDFFAAGNGMRANVSTPPLEVTSYGRALNSYWRMPFRKKARLELANEGTKRLCVYCQMNWIQLPSLPDDTLYFHARYKQECPYMTFEPYVIFEGKGEGQYVGTIFSSQNSYGSWAGEADDRMYVDDEAQPSICGTGTEDWFTDAWNMRVYTNANAGVTIKEPNGVDCRYTAYRWHIAAPMIFHKSLKVEYERRSFIALRDPETGKTVQYDFKFRPDFLSSVAIWYQKGIAEPFCEFPPVSERLDPEIWLEVKDMAGTLPHSEGLDPLVKGNRVCESKTMFYVYNDEVGAWVDVPFTIRDEGQYSISLLQVLFREHGIWKVTLYGPDMEKVLDPGLDFYDPWLARMENQPENTLYGTLYEKKLGVLELAPGEYRFRFECVGSNPLTTTREFGKRGYSLGLDAISLRKLPWDHMDVWMDEYLAKEKALFGRMIATARETVSALASAIETYHRDRGKYPATLDDLTKTKDPGGKPYWPDERIPFDPWNQPYQYECPGRFNPGGFDVYSWHGHSRDTRQWIGNWDWPYTMTGAIEGETLMVSRRGSGERASIQEISTQSIPPTSSGHILFMDLRADGGWLEFALPDAIGSGRYRVTLAALASWDYADTQWSIDGKKLGDPVPAYAPEPVRVVADLGEVTLGDGPHTLRVEASGRQERSQGWCAGLDAVLLTPIL
jgi:hypothetical protein